MDKKNLSTTNDLLTKMYDAHQAGDFVTLKKLITLLKQKDPTSHYINRYQHILSKESSIHQKTVAKQSNTSVVAFSCPHCGSSFSLSWKKQDFDGETLDCVHCHSSFVYTKKNIKTLFSDLRVGHTKTIDQQEYRIAGGVLYKGQRHEQAESWWLRYLERTLLNNKWEIFYLSESIANWLEWRTEKEEKEVELSWKTSLPFSLQEITDTALITDKWSIPLYEIDRVKVKKIQGENIKSYTIGEKVVLYSFRYHWKKYVLEKESTATQQEIGIYQTKTLPLSAIQKTTTIKLSINKNWSVFSSWFSFQWLLWWVSLFILLLIVVVVFHTLWGPSFWPYLSLIVLALCVLFVSFLEKNKKPHRHWLAFVMLLLGIFLFHVTDSPVSDEMSLGAVATSSLTWNFRSMMNDIPAMPSWEKQWASYDRGGVEFHVSRYDGFRFSINNKDDRDALRALLNENLLLIDKTMKESYDTHTRLNSWSYEQNMKQVYYYLLQNPVVIYHQAPFIFSP